MTIKISGAPCSWGVDDVRNPHLPKWTRVLDEASQAGYKGIELGPYGFMPLDARVVGTELQKQGLNIVAGTIFDNLVSEANLDNLLQQADDICGLVKRLPPLPVNAGQKHEAPYLVIIDWGHPERDINAGHPDRAPRLSPVEWAGMVEHIKAIAKLAREKHGVRSVIHPHAGGYIEFEDEIRQLIRDIPHDIAGLCLDTGHLYYSKMDPAQWLKEQADRIDYVHFKDVNARVYEEVMNEKIAFFDACAKGVMCPIGKGDIDYPQIKKVLEEIDYHGYITIEQERDPRDADTSLRDVKASLDYLKSIGFN
jgi:inosose dehydratase